MEEKGPTMVSKSSRWNKKPFFHRSPFLSISLLTLLLTLFFISYHHTPRSLLLSLPKRLTPRIPHRCGAPTMGQKFMWYAPHSGFSNQLSEFKNAVLVAAILNRTLIVPPVLDHHAVALGSCPKFRVSSPSELRIAVWDHVIELIQTGSYVSMVDIIDLSALVSSSSVRTIDFRHFVSLWCGLNFDFTCFNGSNFQTSSIERLRQCRSQLSGLDGNVEKCLYALDEDCRTVVWTYGKEGEDGIMDSFQPDENLKRKKKISYVRRRRDLYKTLGPGSEAESATVLAFGSLFTAPYRGFELYIDIHEAPNNKRIQNLIKRSEFLPFSPVIMSAGKEFALMGIKAPFFCAQLRLLDGQFKNHWKATFMGLRQHLEALRKKGPLPLHVFVMTDLPQGNWTGNYLGDLARDTNFILHVLNEKDELVIETANKLVPASRRNNCPHQALPDILLYMEEAVCSCASLGYYGTSGSTIAENIDLMRKFGVCAGQSLK